MYRPTKDIVQALKPRINYLKTHTRLAQLLKNPASIRPAAAPEHLAAQLGEKKVKAPQLKGNVLHTMKEVMSIFLAEERRAAGVISIAIKTTRTSLAKRCGNLDPKTAYRHIMTLIEHGFLRAKVHIRAGLQLLINPDLLVYDASQAPAPTPSAGATMVAQMPLVSPAEGLANLLSLAQKFAQELAPKSRRPS